MADVTTAVDLFGDPVRVLENRNVGATRDRVRKSDIWLTPPELLAALGPFDLDPCAAPDPRPWPTAARMLTLPTNGLVAPWEGRVWLNPPYGDEAGRWFRRMAAHGDGIAIIPARVETRWAHESIWPKATAVFVFKGRVPFHRADGSRPPGNSGIGHLLVAYGAANVAAITRSGLPGVLIPLEDARFLP